MALRHISLLIIGLTATAASRGEVNSPFDLDPDPRDPTFILELGKESLSKQQQLSKLRLKSSELYLPRHVIPISYKLHLRPILESPNPQEVLTAEGHVEIVVKCVNPTDTILLHAQTREHVKIKEETLRVHPREEEVLGNGSRWIEAVGHAPLEREEADFYQIDLSETLERGQEYTIHMQFVSKISNNTLNGLYLSKYVDPDTPLQKYLAVTQFEAIAARQMFPCFDEPDLKATFQMNISRNASLNSMSNMPLDYTLPDAEKEGYFVDVYPPTPPMSTYLVALVVSEFKCTKAHESLFNKTVEACGPPHLVDRNGTEHASQVSARILHFYEQLWGVPYPLPKMQSVAIPDFEAGAMENYGLNTYKISGLIWFPETSSESERSRVESTIAHELAHQNFGNLVTCKSWNEIFLNEGFATYVASLGQEAVSPEFETRDFAWYTGYFQRALKRDAQADTHPVVKEDFYLGDFDAISYSKGASLIKMMENILSRDTLINGLTNYLKAFSFGNARYHNLFETLDTQATLDKTHPQVASMTEIMETWTIQPGFPLITVQAVSPTVFKISQERFLAKPTLKWSDHKNYSLWSRSDLNESSSDNNKTLLWHCPLFISTSRSESASTTPTLWLSNTQSVTGWTSSSPVEWIIVNENSRAFLRVLYDAKLSALIEAQLDMDCQVFSPITRAQLIDDAFECAWSRYNSVLVALGRTKFLSQESNASVWATAFTHLRLIYKMISGEKEAVVNFKNYLRPRVQYAVDSVGVEQLAGDKGRLVLHRQSLLAWGTLLQLPNVMTYAQRLLTKAKSSETLEAIPVDIRGEILCACVRSGNATQFVLERYNKSVDEKERKILVGAMGCSTDLDYLKGLLNNATNPEFMLTKTDSFTLVQKLVVNPVSRQTTFWHIRRNLVSLLEYFGTADYVAWLLSSFAQFWNTRAQLTLMHDLVEEYGQELKSVEESVNQTISRIEDNILWMDTHASDIKTWFQQQQPNNLTSPL